MSEHMIDDHKEDMVEKLSEKNIGKTGQYLRDMRQKKQYSYEDIHKKLCIRPRIIKAIENHHYEILPDTVTAAALIRQYALFLGLDAALMSDAYKQDMQGTDQKIDVVFPEKLPSSFLPLKNLVFISLLCMAAYGMWHYARQGRVLINNITPLDNLASVTDMVIASGAGSNDAQQINQGVRLDIPQKEHFIVQKYAKILLKAQNGESWFEIKSKSSGRVIHSAILRDGQSYQIPLDGVNLRLKAGNSAPLTLWVNNRPLGLIPKKSRVLRDFNIDPDYLMNYARENQKSMNKKVIH